MLLDKQKCDMRNEGNKRKSDDAMRIYRRKKIERIIKVCEYRTICMRLLLGLEKDLFLLMCVCAFERVKRIKIYRVCDWMKPRKEKRRGRGKRNDGV